MIISVSIPRWFDSSVPGRARCGNQKGVSIPRWFDSSLTPMLYIELSDYVSIPRWFDSSTTRDLIYDRHITSFNSTMVRFKQNIKSAIERASIRFQFHDGSIQAGQRWPSPELIRRFNSTMVRFKQKLSKRDDADVGCFNSTMVRFKPG